MKSAVVNAPEPIREQLRGLSTKALVEACAGLRPGTVEPGVLAAAVKTALRSLARRIRMLDHEIAALEADLHPLVDDAAADLIARFGVGYEAAVKTALRSLARRIRMLDHEIAALEADLHPLVDDAAADLIARFGVGYETAAQLLITVGDNPDRISNEAAFASLCGVAPIPASSGKTSRHRLNRGGNRQANRALHIIVLARLKRDPRTRAYRDKRLAQGKSKRDIIRCLKANRALHIIVLARLKRDPRTRAYRDKRLAQGKSKRDIIRCLKRAVAREMFQLLTQKISS
ncbi:transposase [Rhodococcoides kyotonense]|uniref:Transposase IS116/IS110/IS902 C-terminal domain-containing protein n=1 Tax=Rhodococcoides kyotonense TaxID=398843 RepID=A0A177YPF5_9NOCA|nr:transposase [Rhodococcus kyotonensis]OAK57261.1 hypothetical protein A3K89_00045 [Rhodococcus kyotonensis]